MDSKRRNIGIELLRVVAMWMIVVGHVVKFIFNYWELAEAANG